MVVIDVVMVVEGVMVGWRWWWWWRGERRRSEE